MNKEELKAIEKLKETQDSYLKDELDYAIDTVLNLIQKQEKIIDKATETLEQAKLSYFKKEDGGELIGQYRCFNKYDWKEYFKKEVEKEC